MVTTHYKIRIGKDNREKIASLALLADLHNLPPGREMKDLLAAIDSAGVSAVLCAGDLMTVTGDPAKQRYAMALIRKLAGKYPVYLANGNHEMRLKEWEKIYPGEYAEYAEKVRSFGACLLDNESVRIDIGTDSKVYVTGFSIPVRWYDRLHPQKMTAADVTAAVGPCVHFHAADPLSPDHGKRSRKKADGKYQILLAHHPEYFDAYAAWGADLVLAGHLHGGMVRLPLLGGVIGGTLRPFPKYDKGSFVKGDTRMIVSAGLGMHSFPLRVNNPPELVILELY